MFRKLLQPRPARRPAAQAALCVALGLALGCNNIPVDRLDKSFALKVHTGGNTTKAVKVDFVWVIDPSTSMCQEQASLAQSFKKFIDQISQAVNIDYRIAVITTDGLSGDEQGRFRHNLTQTSPFACAESIVQTCQPGAAGNQSCSSVQGKGPNWICKGPTVAKEQVNCNASINNYCQKACDSDGECDKEFLGADAEAKCKANPKDCTYHCVKPGGGESGCVLQPPTLDCPDTDTLHTLMTDDAATNKDACGGDTNLSAPYLTNKNASELFKCVGTVGTLQESNATLEQPLSTTLMALSPTGFNGVDKSGQAKCFLRDDAYLVVVMVSDEDDCSVAQGVKLGKDRYGTCNCLPDSDTLWDDPNDPGPNLVPGPLLSITDAANRIKALKSDPGKVLVAAIFGDVEQQDTEKGGINTRVSCFEMNEKFRGKDTSDPALGLDDLDKSRLSYCQSKCNLCADPSKKHNKLFQTYVCESPTGKADYGSRYNQFVRRFGKNGIVTNICDDQGLAPALTTIATRIIKVFTKICLPRPIKDEQSLVVTTVGPAGKCLGNNSDCSLEPGAPPCSDKTECIGLRTTAILSTDGTVPGKFSYRIVVNSDCTETTDQKSIVFNDVLPAGIQIEVDYFGLTSLDAQQKPTSATP